MDSSIEWQIRALVASTLHVDPAIVRRDATLAGDLAADSLDLVSLLLAVEDEFRIDIHDEEAVEILTVEQLIDYVSYAIAIMGSTRATRSNCEGALTLR